MDGGKEGEKGRVGAGRKREGRRGNLGGRGRVALKEEIRVKGKGESEW